MDDRPVPSPTSPFAGLVDDRSPRRTPFRAGDGAVPPVFAGRDDLFEVAYDSLGSLAEGHPASRHIIEAPRGLGKTAVLAAVRDQARAMGLYVVALEGDPGEAATQLANDEFVRLIDQEMGVAGRAKGLVSKLRSVKVGPGGIEVVRRDTTTDRKVLERLIHDAAKLAQADDTGLFITLDEAHEAEASLLQPTLRALHLAEQDRLPATGWVAGLPGSLDRLIEAGQTYAERIPLAQLGRLTQPEVASAIGIPFAQADITLAPKVSDIVAYESGGYPYFVQVWGEELWRHRQGPDTVTLGDVGRVKDRVNQRVDTLMASRWRRMTPSGRAFAAAMASLDGPSPWNTADVAAAMDRPRSSISQVRAQLIDDGMIHAPAWGKIEFTVPGYANWINAMPQAARDAL